MDITLRWSLVWTTSPWDIMEADLNDPTLPDCLEMVGFRLAHLGAIAIVVAEAWFGVVCPLPSPEMWLRTKVHESTYTGSFVEHWLQRLLYYAAPSWVFSGLFVAATWWYFPPRFKWRA